MKLYYSQGACSLSPHIALFEAGADLQAIKVGRDEQTEDGRDFREINPLATCRRSKSRAAKCCSGPGHRAVHRRWFAGRRS